MTYRGEIGQHVARSAGVAETQVSAAALTVAVAMAAAAPPNAAAGGGGRSIGGGLGLELPASLLNLVSPFRYVEAAQCAVQSVPACPCKEGQGSSVSTAY